MSSNLQRWQGNFKQLQMWSGASGKKSGQQDQHQQSQELNESIEYLVLLFTSGAHVREKTAGSLDEALRKQLDEIYDACIELLQSISSGLAQQQKIPGLPDTVNLFREAESRGEDIYRFATDDKNRQVAALQFMSEISQLRFWIEAISNCREKANVIDWKALNRDYF